MPTDEINARSCPLRNQTGVTGVQHFRAILASLPPEQRAAFEAERAERQRELATILATACYQT